MQKLQRPDDNVRMTDKHTDRQTHGQTDTRTDKHTNRRTHGQTNTRTDGRTDFAIPNIPFPVNAVTRGYEMTKLTMPTGCEKMTKLTMPTGCD